MQEYDVWTSAFMPDGTRHGYVPATVRGDSWDLERLLHFLQGEANLGRREVYMGGYVDILIRPHNDRDTLLVQYRVTGGYVRGFIWERVQ
jgi:hypothetical protein